MLFRQHLEAPYKEFETFDKVQFPFPRILHSNKLLRLSNRMEYGNEMEKVRNIVWE